MNIQELAEEALKSFERKTFNEGMDQKRSIWVFTLSREQWVHALVYKAHDNTLPDDYKFAMVVEALEAISNGDLDFDDVEAPIYTAELTKWLHSNVSRVYYLGQALEEFAPTDGFQALALAWRCEFLEIANSVKESLEERLSEMGVQNAS